MLLVVWLMWKEELGFYRWVDIYATIINSEVSIPWN